MRIPETRYTWPVNISASLWHWNGKPGGGCSHGPASTCWPWWKLITARAVKPAFHPTSPCIGLIVWIYTRWGALPIDVVVDRRKLGLKRKTQTFRFRAWLASKIDPIGRALVR